MHKKHANLSDLHCVEDALHIVQAFFLAHHEPGSGGSAVGQHGPGAGLVLQGQGLVAGVDVNLVDANPTAQPQGVDTDFVLGALALSGTAAILPGVGTTSLIALNSMWAVPLGASTFRVWWTSTISISASGK